MSGYCRLLRNYSRSLGLTELIQILAGFSKLSRLAALTKLVSNTGPVVSTLVLDHPR